MEELRNEALPDDTDSGKRLGLGAKRLGIVNAVLCSLLIAAIVVSVVLCEAPPPGDSGAPILGLIMFSCLVPVASIPIGLSCLVGAIRSGAAVRRQASREARIGLWLSLGGSIAVIACYALGFILFPYLSILSWP